MKILYYVGENITTDTKVIRVPGGGTMIKIVNNGSVIFLNVPRIYIDRGNGFCVSNYFKTMKLKKIIENQIN